MRGMGRVLTLVAAVLALTIPFFITSASFLRIEGFDRLIDSTVDDIARSQVLMGLISALVILTVGVILVGRSSSVRPTSESITTAALNQRYAEAMTLVRDVTSEPDVSVLVVDGDGKILFGNAAAASRGGKSEGELIGRPITALYGAAESERMRKFISQALDERATIRDRRTVRSSKTNNIRMFVTHFYPLASNAEGQERVLLVDRDISEAALERDRRRRSVDRLINLLMKVASRLDSRTMVQASRISELAGLLAVKLELAPERVEAVKTAGRLLGVGRFFASDQAIDGPAERMRRRQEATAVLVENLKNIDFEGPVVETLRQMYERWDGKGPAQRSGITIEPTARILSVATAFLSMISARPDRQPGMSLEQAAQSLMDGADKVYERRVVRALLQHLDEGGRKIWEEVRTNGDASISALTPNFNPHRDTVILSDAPAEAEEEKKAASTDKSVANAPTAALGKPQAASVKKPAFDAKKERHASQSIKPLKPPTVKGVPSLSGPQPSITTHPSKDVSAKMLADTAAATKLTPAQSAERLRAASPEVTTTAPSAPGGAPSKKPPTIRIHTTPKASSSKKDSA